MNGHLITPATFGEDTIFTPFVRQLVNSIPQKVMDVVKFGE